MADNYKTMIPLDSLNRGPGRWQRVYECEVCHGVLFGEGVERTSKIRCSEYDDPARLSCSLCDESAPLSRRYRMALNTLAGNEWALYRDPVDPADFASFDTVSLNPEDDTTVVAEFEYRDMYIKAGPHDISVLNDGPDRQLHFDFGLDAEEDPYGPKHLALEVVNRVRRDLDFGRLTGRA